jgi:hypothetical protein
VEAFVGIDTSKLRNAVVGKLALGMRYLRPPWVRCSTNHKTKRDRDAVAVAGYTIRRRPLRTVDVTRDSPIHRWSKTHGCGRPRHFGTGQTKRHR